MPSSKWLNHALIIKNNNGSIDELIPILQSDVDNNHQRKAMIDNFKKAEILWASSRELYNIIQAINCNCQIITVGHDLLNKIDLFGKDLDIFSLETVKMFYSDATAANFNINTEK